MLPKLKICSTASFSSDLPLPPPLFPHVFPSFPRWPTLAVSFSAQRPGNADARPPVPRDRSPPARHRQAPGFPAPAGRPLPRAALGRGGRRVPGGARQIVVSEGATRPRPQAGGGGAGGNGRGAMSVGRAGRAMTAAMAMMAAACPPHPALRGAARPRRSSPWHPPPLPALLRPPGLT